MLEEKDFSYISNLEIEEKVNEINRVRRIIHEISPFKKEPVDCVFWAKTEDVIANDYNPNSVAPPEMTLLETSIEEDGYTQPIVSWKKKNSYEIVDGFHRNRVGKECSQITKRIHGYLPITVINEEKTDKSSRMASTIRHNRARGKHSVNVMSEIVLELKNRNWTNKRIAKQLGMDEDEILRLCQITGLANLFSDEDFSKSWDIEKSKPSDINFEQVENIIDDEEVNDGDEKTTTMNTSDENRTFHTYDKWECYKYNFYGTKIDGLSKDECENKYVEVLGDSHRFSNVLNLIIEEWNNSCEHYLTNHSMNRIAWLGQAAVARDSMVPSKFCTGWSLLSEDQQTNADLVALKYLNKWLISRGQKEVTMKEAKAEGRTSVLY